MHTWTGIATAIGGLLTLATAAINLATVILTRLHRSRCRHHLDDGGRNPAGQ